MACPGCPDAVANVLRGKVQVELDKLAAITSMTNIFNDAVGEVAGTGFEDVQSAVNAVPAPVSLSPLDLLEYVTCPLTVLALGLGGIQELLDGDVNTQTKAVQGLTTGNINKARQEYEGVLNRSPNAGLIRQVRKYERQLRQIGFNAATFAEAVLITASVQDLCDEDEFNEGPYLQFATLASNFSFTGGVPTGLDQNLAAVVQQLQQGELKFAALRASLK
jgi:hypothetical protein